MEETTRGQFPTTDMVQIVRRAMGDEEGHMRRGPAIGLVERGAQLPKPDIFRMALRDRIAGKRYCGRGKCRHPCASCPSH